MVAAHHEGATAQVAVFLDLNARVDRLNKAGSKPVELCQACGGGRLVRQLVTGFELVGFGMAGRLGSCLDRWVSVVLVGGLDPTLTGNQWVFHGISMIDYYLFFMIDLSTNHKPSRFPYPPMVDQQLLQEDPDILHMIQRKLVSKKLETLPASPTHVAPPVKINLEARGNGAVGAAGKWLEMVPGFPSQNLPFPVRFWMFSIDTCGYHHVCTASYNHYSNL